MDLEEKHRLIKTWRGRRLLMCRAASDIHDLIEQLGVEVNSDPIPNDFQSTVTDDLKRELQNQAAVLLRTVLLLNDGNISPSRLQRF